MADLTPAEKLQASVDELAAMMRARNVPAGRLDRWVDRRSIAPALVVALVTLGGGWLTWRDDIKELKRDRDEAKLAIQALQGARDMTGLAAKVDTAVNSGVQNAGAISRVEGAINTFDKDSRDRDEKLDRKIDKVMDDHRTYDHGHGRRSTTLFEWPSGLPMLSAATGSGG
jgi:hypothetical protein